MSTGTDPITLTDKQREQLARILKADEPVEVIPDTDDSFWVKSKGTYDALLVRFADAAGEAAIDEKSGRIVASREEVYGVMQRKREEAARELGGEYFIIPGTRVEFRLPEWSVGSVSGPGHESG